MFHDADARPEPGGLIERYLRATGWEVELVERASDMQWGAADLMVHLGSDPNPADPDAADIVDPERRALRDALDAGVPVLGVCFGAQLLADVLGGDVHEAPVAEFGMHTVESVHPLCPEGPWAQSHRHAFTVPAGATELGRSAAGPQGLLVDAPTRALGWQFHPEVTPVTARRWAETSPSWAPHADAVIAHLLDENTGHAERAGRLIATAISWLMATEGERQ